MMSRATDVKRVAAPASNALARFIPLDQWLMSAPRSSADIALYHRVKAELIEGLDMANRQMGRTS